MGADVSRNLEQLAHLQRSHQESGVQRRPAGVRHRSVAPITSYRSPTQPVFECALQDWLSGYHSLLGFEGHLLTCQNRINHDCGQSCCVGRLELLSPGTSHRKRSPSASLASCIGPPANLLGSGSTRRPTKCTCPSGHLECSCSAAYHTVPPAPAEDLKQTIDNDSAHEQLIARPGVSATESEQDRSAVVAFIDWVNSRRRRRGSRIAAMFEYNHLPAYLSSIENYHVKSVLCARGAFVILHLECEVSTQFGIVDLHSNAFQGVFGLHQATFDGDSLFGDLTPDLTRCLIRLPVSLRNDVPILNSDVGRNNFSAEPHILLMYDLRSKQALYQVCIQSNMERFTFDTRFQNSRLAITNFERNALNSISLVTLDKWQTRVSNTRINDRRSALHPYLRALQYTPDGFYLLAVVTDAECRCREQRRFRTYQRILASSKSLQWADREPSQASASEHPLLSANIGTPMTCNCYVLNADSLAKLYAVSFDRYVCGVHLCSANFTPIFSACATKMALVNVLANRPQCGEFVQIFKLPPPVGRLEALCRVIIRQNFSEHSILKMVQDGRLPRRLLNFLLFKPMYTCAGSCLTLWPLLS